MRTIVRVLAAVSLVMVGPVPAYGADTYPVTGDVLTAGGALVAPVRLEVFTACPDPDATAMPIRSVPVRDAPSYRILLEPGTYRVRILQGDQRIASWHGATLTCETSPPLTVSAETLIDLVASRVVTVSGVVDTARGRLTEGVVRFYTDCAAFARSRWTVDEDGNPVGQYTAVAAISNGVFSATLPAGRFRVSISGDTMSWHPAQRFCDASQEVVIDSDAQVTLTASTLMTVTGSVVSRLGPALNGRVNFYADCAAAPAATAKLVDSAFTVKVLPGDYRVLFIPSGNRRLVDSWHAETLTCEQAAPVTISQDQSLQLSTLASQSIAMRTYRYVRTAKVVLPRRTREGARVTWRLMRTKKSNKVCKLRKNVITARDQGSCRLKAAAPARPGYIAYAGTFEVGFGPKRS